MVYVIYKSWQYLNDLYAAYAYRLYKMRFFTNHIEKIACNPVANELLYRSHSTFFGFVIGLFMLCDTINVLRFGINAYDALDATISPYCCRSFAVPTVSGKFHERFRLGNHMHFGMALPKTKISGPNRYCVEVRLHITALICRANWIHRMWLHAKLFRMFHDRLKM